MNEKAKETYLNTDSGENGFIRLVYDRYGKKLYSYAIRNWKLGEDDAWELTYKTLYKVAGTYKSYSFQSEEKFASFIFRIFINYLRNHYRDSKLASEKLSVSTVPEETLNETAEDIREIHESPRMKALNEELEKMEDWQRMLLLMRTEGRPYSEIAKYIDKPEDQLKVYYQRLKEQITKRMNERA